MKFYRVYRTKDGELLAEGNAFECTEKLGFASPNCFHTTVSHCKSGRNRRYRIESEEMNLTEKRKGDRAES